MNMTTKEYREIVRAKVPVADLVPRQVIPRGMNKLESLYAAHLNLRKQDGEIVAWSFEHIRIRLANGAWFKPDFLVRLTSGEIQSHETKGFMREAAAVRLKVAAEITPWRFVLVKRIKGRWTFANVPGLIDRISAPPNSVRFAHLLNGEDEQA